ncbi:MAG: gamma carbonic anhydrase family protein [Desulfarculus sp.]|nr:MAG: gamma carbonic anhydrase family protein [Desulfarculus sp.]
MIAMVNGKTPRVHPTAFVAPGAYVLGDVELGPQASVWYGCVLRGDVNLIQVGERSNLQDQTVLHANHRGHGVLVGAEVMVGHRVILHACTVGARALIGMGAVVLDGAVVGEGALVAAGAVVSPGTQVPPLTMVAGVPAKVRRQVTPEELANRRAAIERYIRLSACHADPSLVHDFSREA